MAIRMLFFWMLLLKGVLTQNTILLGRNKLTNYCYDENETLMFVCSVEDDSHHAATVWSGTAFNCSSVLSITNNQIYLAHLQYSSFAYGSCNGGALSAEGVGVDNSLYTSTLTVMPGSLEVPNGKTIDCSLSGGTIFGLVIFRVGVVPEPPIGNGFIFSVETSQLLTVSWTEPLGVTGGVGGFLVDVSSDCGQCDNVGRVSANVTDMSCWGWEPIGQTCNISVYTVTAYCQVQSVIPLLFAINFKLPEIPNITAIIATYELSGNLKRITTTLSKKQNTMDENGLTVIYVLAYTHSSIGSNPVEVLLDCSESIDCMDVFEVDRTQKFGEYSVAVGAMTPIGKTVQHSKTIGVTNTFMYATVDVLESYTIVNCFFLAKYDHISCQVEYSHDCNMLSNSKRRSVVNASDVSIILESISPSTVYCFVLTADNQSHTVKAQGNFSGYTVDSLLSNACNSGNNSSNNSGNNSSNNSGNNSGNILSTGLIVIMGVTILMALVALMALIAIIIVLYKK